MPYNAEWEDHIKVFRKNRRLLVARGIDFTGTRAAFEAGIRAKLTKPNSVIFLWPPSADNSNPTRHSGWVMLGFNQRPDVKTAEDDLKNHEFRGRPVRIDRASRVAYNSSSSGTQETNATMTPTVGVPTTTAPPTTAAPTAPSTAPSTAAENLPSQTPLAHGTTGGNNFSSLENPSLQEILERERHRAPGARTRAVITEITTKTYVVDYLDDEE
ncbi:hypothetical protein EsH8_X_000495 [Colletotrichum jinshuiense]